MTAPEIISAVESVGGQLLVEGDHLRLRSPVPVPAEIKNAIREHKPELIEALCCAHGRGCPHSSDYLVAEFERTAKLRVEFEGSAVYLVRTYEIAGTINDGIVYMLSEWTRLARLPIEEIRLMHRLRNIGGPGGTTELKETK
jgi:tubulysin polyketide synthase-like protein